MLALGLVLVAASSCSTHDGDCGLCVGNKSTFGTCRFCPRDQKCHDAGAVFTNPCSFSHPKNIKDADLCDGPLDPPTAPVAEVPLYCSALVGGMRAVQWQPLLKDIVLAAVAPSSVAGPVNISLAELEFGAVNVTACDAAAKEEHLTVRVDHVTVELTSFQYTFAQQHWPHAADAGHATGKLQLSLSIALDLKTMTEEVVDVSVEALHTELESAKHPWVVDVVQWMANHGRAVVGAAVQMGARGLVSKALKEVQAEGSCAFANGLLQENKYIEPQVLSNVPVKVHVPLFGTVDIRVNTTHVSMPTHLTCGEWSFNGTDLAMSFSDLALGMQFDWSYQKENSTFWENAGSGVTHADVGADLKMSLLHPSGGHIAIKLPELRVHLHADHDSWMYAAMSSALTPIFRLAAEHFAGDLVRKQLACLADPGCTSAPPQLFTLVV